MTKLTILTTITNPEQRQDKWIEALNCYLDIADEVVVVNGGKPITLNDVNKISKPDKECDLKFVDLEWPSEWNWVELPKHLNAGLEQCTGDFVIKLDIDQLLHERDKDGIRFHLEQAVNYKLVSFSKFTVVTPTGAYQKGQLAIAINRKFKNIYYGEAEERTDLCFPIEKETEINVGGYMLPKGKSIKEVYRTGIKYYNYDYFFKEVDYSLKEFQRFAVAYEKFYKRQPFTQDTFMGLRQSYLKKITHKMTLKDHPIYIEEAVQYVIDNPDLKIVANII